jgi:hypothetical protein
MVDPNGTTTYAYDSLDRLTAVTRGRAYLHARLRRRLPVDRPDEPRRGPSPATPTTPTGGSPRSRTAPPSSPTTPRPGRQHPHRRSRDGPGRSASQRICVSGGFSLRRRAGGTAVGEHLQRVIAVRLEPAAGPESSDVVELRKRPASADVVRFRAEAAGRMQAADDVRDNLLMPYLDQVAHLTVNRCGLVEHVEVGAEDRPERSPRIESGAQAA